MAVLELLPTELSAREIGERLFLSRNTVKTHLRHIFDKLSVHSRAEAVTRARQIGMLPAAGDDRPVDGG